LKHEFFHEFRVKWSPTILKIKSMTHNTKPGLSEGTLHEQLTDSSKSAFARYQELALGSNSIAYLIKYEIIMLFASWVPGALGLVLRKALYPFLIAKVGRNVVFGQGVALRHGPKIQIGDGVIIDDGAVLDAKGGGNKGITIGDNTIVSRNVVLSCKNGDITIGSNCTLGINTLVHAMEGSDVAIGNDVLIGAFCYFIGSGPYGTQSLELPFKKQGMIPQGGIRISDNIWFGSNVQVFDGVNIASGSIVGASTVVNKDINEFDVVAGVPMKILKNRKTDS
jgi:acetyltransferase-like isoleucine patch superfamily enzyme